jgi:protein gp37
MLLEVVSIIAFIANLAFKDKQNDLKAKIIILSARYLPERLLKAPPRTKDGEFIFFPSMGDLYFASPQQFQAHINYARKYSDRTFLIQSKNPSRFRNFGFPDNVILGTTIETNYTELRTPSEYRYYAWISARKDGSMQCVI